MTVRLATTNQVPFNTVIVTTGNLVGDTPEASSYYLLRLAAPTTSATVVLDVSATSFLTQFAVAMNSDQPSNYVAAVLTPGSAGSPAYTGSLAATPTVTFGSAPCQHTQQFTNVALAVAISAGHGDAIRGDRHGRRECARGMFGNAHSVQPASLRAAGLVDPAQRDQHQGHLHPGDRPARRVADVGRDDFRQRDHRLAHLPADR